MVNLNRRALRSIDIGKVRLKATVQVQGGARWKTRREVRTFERTTPGLLALREWLVSEQVTFGRDGVTGVFWKLIYYLLEDVVECWRTPVAGTSCTRQR
jgi:transposase